VAGAVVLVFVGQGIDRVRHLHLSKIDFSNELPCLVSDITWLSRQPASWEQGTDRRRNQNDDTDQAIKSGVRCGL
jgi:hypothetical protein